MGLVKSIQDWDSRRKQIAAERLLADGLRDRKAARRFIRWYDHGVFRGFWTNFHQVAPGVFRSNYPSEQRFADLVKRGIKTVITLRGADNSVQYQFEKKLCSEHGLGLLAVNLNARAAPAKENLQELIALLRLAQHPMLIHCKSGADRAGLASAIYLLVFENASPAEAAKMLSRKFLHFSSSKTGVLDQILVAYGARHQQDGIGFEDWLRTEYDREAIQRAFDAKRA